MAPLVRLIKAIDCRHPCRVARRRPQELHARFMVTRAAETQSRGLEGTRRHALDRLYENGVRKASTMARETWGMQAREQATARGVRGGQGLDRGIFLLVRQQIRTATVGDLQNVEPGSQVGRALARCFTVWPYHRIDDVVLQHAADRRCRLRRIAADLFPCVRHLDPELRVRISNGQRDRPGRCSSLSPGACAGQKDRQVKRCTHRQQAITNARIMCASQRSSITWISERKAQPTRALESDRT